MKNNGLPEVPENRCLGESGLWEDENGEFVSPPGGNTSNISNDGRTDAWPADKTDPEYWRFYYDPRYCGPSPEAYMEKMAAKAKAEQEQARKQKENKRLDKTFHIVGEYSDGLAVAQDKKTMKYGYADTSGALVIPCIWHKARSFTNGLTKVSDSKVFFFLDKWVVIDKEGRIVSKDQR